MSISRWITLMLTLLVCGCSKEYLVWYGHSPDRLHRVEVIEKDKRQQLKLDATLSQPYLGVALETIVFSEDSQRFAYAAKTDAGWIVTVDGVHSRPWTGIGEILFGPGQQLAYVASDSDGWQVVREGVRSAPFEAVMQGSLTFSPDGHFLAFVIAEGNQFRVVVKGELGPLYEGIGALRFGPNSKQLAYIVRKGGRQYLALDNQLLGPFNAIADFTLGSNGRLGMLVRSDDGWRAVIDGQESEVFDNFSSIRFSQGGQYAYAAERDDNWFIIRDGTRSLAFSSVSQLTFAGESLFYEASWDGDTFVVADTIRGTSLKWVGRLIVSPDGLHLAYMGQPWGRSVSVFYDGAVMDVPHAISGTLVLSNDYQHWACLVQDERDGGIDIIIDGQFRAPFDLEEMMALIMLTPNASGAQHEKMIRRWVKAELEAYYADVASTQPSAISKHTSRK
ncbi:hypothetical protein F4Z99_10305 [Candidatus Poribacteria bacterium]|nr:hypothetical protein [Candidatus Poribacteria bacterium]MYA98880.1 hypothetical protein [Candidatus Poribacteria bacterium]